MLHSPSEVVGRAKLAKLEFAEGEALEFAQSLGRHSYAIDQAIQTRLIAESLDFRTPNVLVILLLVEVELSRATDDGIFLFMGAFLAAHSQEEPESEERKYPPRVCAPESFYHGHTIPIRPPLAKKKVGNRQEAGHSGVFHAAI